MGYEFRTVSADWLKETGRLHPGRLEALLFPEEIWAEPERLYKCGEDPFVCGGGDRCGTIAVPNYRHHVHRECDDHELIWDACSSAGALVFLAVPGHHWSAGPSGPGWVERVARTLGDPARVHAVSAEINWLWLRGFLVFHDAKAAPKRSPRRKKPIPGKLRWEVFKRDDFRCRHCGTRDDLAADHIHPESMGGPTTLGNLQTLCRPCNSRKGARVTVGVGG
jgi:hypothetical protein